jgi:hypothetical protein
MAVYDILPNEDLRDVDIVATLNANGGTVDFEKESWYKPSANVNKWSYNKPESYPSMFEMTDDERYMNNHGFDLSSISNVAVSQLFAKAASGDTWKYILPSGETLSPYRMSDFRGYNPNAAAPFNYDSIAKSGAVVNFPYIADWLVKVNPASEIKMSDLNVFDTLNAGYYFFIAKNGSQYVLSSLVPRNEDPTSIICTMRLPSEGTWECIFVMGQNSAETIENRTDITLLPEGYFTFKLEQKYVFINVTYTGGEVAKIDYNKYEYLLTIGNVSPSYRMVASDPTVPITNTELEFGFEVHILNSSKDEIAVKSIYSTSGSDKYTFNSVNGTQDKSLVDFPGVIDMKEYFNESVLYNAKYARFYPKANKISGPGIPSNPSTYFEIEL